MLNSEYTHRHRADVGDMRIILLHICILLNK